jgi:hypothetical protein
MGMGVQRGNTKESTLLDFDSSHQNWLRARATQN